MNWTRSVMFFFYVKRIIRTFICLGRKEFMFYMLKNRIILDKQGPEINI